MSKQGSGADLHEGGDNDDQGGEEHRMAGLPGLQIHQRYPLVNPQNQSVRQVLVKLVNDEKENDRQKFD